MKTQLAALCITLILGWTAASSGQLNLKLNSEREQSRTALPLLLLLGYPGLGVVPGIPLRRPQDEPSLTRDPPKAMEQQLVQSDEMAPASSAVNAQIREQFIQGLLQGLQSNAGPTLQPAVLADLLQQLQVQMATKAPAITPPPVQKEAQSPPSNDSSNDNDPDYDYIDFKNGSRIKYELEDNNKQINNSQYTNKTPGELPINALNA